MISGLRVFLLLLSVALFTQTAHAQLTFSPSNNYILDTICQGQSIDHCFNVSSAGTSHSIIGFTGNDGTIVIAPVSNPFQRCFRYTAPFGFTGPDAIVFTLQNNLGQTGTCTVTIYVANPSTPINAGPDQQLCAPSSSSILTATLTAINPDPLADGYWTKLTGPGIISGGFDSPAIPLVDDDGGPTVTISNLTLGQHIFIYRQRYPCANNLDLVTINVYNGNPPVADANICFPSTLNHAEDTITLCGANTYALCANNPGTAATGTWTIFCGSGSIANINNPSATVNNLGVGCNCLEWNIGNGPCPGGETKDTLTICTYPVVQPAVLGIDLERCLGSFANVNLVGNSPTGANTGQWTFVSGPAAINIVSPNAANTVTTGYTVPGIYCFNWTITSGPCGSSTDQICVYVYAPTSPVNAGPDQTLCLPNNSTTLAAVAPIAPASGTWSVVSGSGSFASPNSPTSTVSGLGVGVNRFRWTIDNGNCANDGTSDLVDIIVYPTSQPTPNAGTDQYLCYLGAAMTTTVTANSPLAPGTGAWTISPSASISPSINAPTISVSGLTPGEYTLTWTLSNGTCSPVVSDEMKIFVYNNTITSTNAGFDVNLCTPTNSAVMAATPATSPAVGEWTVVQGGGTIQSVNSPTTNIIGIPVGINRYRWTITTIANSCGSYFDEVVVNVFDNSATTALAGPDQEFCNLGGSVNAVMAANAPISPATGSWSGSPSVLPSNSPTGAVTGLPVGTNTYTWTINNGACGSSTDQVTLLVYGPGQTNANAGADQELCSNNPTAVLVGNSLVNPATGMWNIVSGGGVITTPNASSTTLTAIPVGITVLTWTVDNGPCATPTVLVDTVRVFMYSTLQTPANAGVDINECSTESTVTLNANDVIFPGVGTWTVSPLGPVFSNSNDPDAVVNNLTAGTTYTFTWTIDNGNLCGTTSDQVTVNYFNSAQTIANAGLDQEICTPTSSVVLNGNLPDSPATGTWSVISGPNTPLFSLVSSPNATLSNLIVGTYVLRWTINNGPCNPSTTFDEVTIFVFPNGDNVANAGSDQDVCEPVSSVTLTGNPLIGPATGIWTQVAGPNTANINNPNLSQVTASDLIVGCYVFRWTVDNGSCAGGLTFDEVEICVFDDGNAVAAAGLDQVICTPLNSTTLAGSAVITPAVGTWTLISGPNSPTFNSNQANTAVSNLIVGTYILRWTVDNGPCSQGITTDEMMIEVFNSSAAIADAGLSQSICTPASEVTMGANAAIAPAIGTWSSVIGSGSITALNDPNTTITNLFVGTSCFQWTIDNGGCGSGTTFDQVCIDAYGNQLPANAGEDQDLCTPQSTTVLEGNAIISPAIGTWTQVDGPTVVAFDDAQDPETGISNLINVGCYTFVWTIDNGVCTNPLTTDTVQVCVFNSGFDPANAGLDQELCSPNASTVLAAVAAEAPGIGTWVADASNPTTVVFSDPNDPSSTVSNLNIGVYTFYWGLNYAACGSEDDAVTVTVFDSNQTPAFAGDDVSICTPTSSVVLNANAILPPSTGTWSAVNGAASFVDVNDPNTTAFNLTQGVDTLIWSIYSGSCLGPEFSVDTVLIFLNDINQLEANAGLDQEWCTPVSTANLVGNALIYPASSTWSSLGSASIDNANDEATGVSNLVVGINTFCYAIENGACIPTDTEDCVDIYIFDADQAPADAGSDQELCSNLTDCATLAGNTLIFPASGQWTTLAGPSTLTYSDATSPIAVVCGLVPGVYTLEWCVDNGPCGPVTCDQMTITMFDDSAEPSSVGSDIELCSPASSAEMNANVVPLPGFGIWEVVGGAGTISADDLDNPQATITDMPIGINSFSWCISNGVCPDANSCDTLNITIFDENALPADAGIDQDWCEPTSCVTMAAGAPTYPAVGTWTSLATGPIISDPNDPSAEFCNLGVGEYYFLWTVYNGPCDNSVTTDLIRVRIYEENQPAANAGMDVSICTPQSVVDMLANPPIFPAIGYWNALPGGNGSIAGISNPTAQITQLLPGESCFVWTIENGPCVPSITNDEICIQVYDANLPIAYAGEDIYLCSPGSNQLLNGFLTGSDLGDDLATGLWEQVSGPNNAVILSPMQSNTTLNGLAVGVYIFRWTVINGPCGTTADEVSLYVNDPGEAVAEAGDDAYYCTPDECHVLNANVPIFPATGYWSTLPGTSACFNDINNGGTEVCCLNPGQTILFWNIDNGACGETVDVASVFIYFEFNPDANAGPDQEICLPDNEVIMVADAPLFPAIGDWEAIGACGDIGDLNSPSSVMSNLCLGTHCFVWRVDNGPCPNGITTDTMCVRVYEPSTMVDAGLDLEICTPQSEVVMTASMPQDPNIGTWNLTSGGGTIQNPNDPFTAISDLPVGINCFRWEYYNGTCENALPSDDMCIYVYPDNHPDANAGEDIEMCFPENDTTVTANTPIIPAIGYWTMIQGSGTIESINNPTTALTDLGVGDNLLVWTILNGPCLDSVLTDTVLIKVFPQNPQIANAGFDEFLCTPEDLVVLNATPPIAPSYGYWEVISLGGLLLDTTAANAEVSFLTVGIHTLQWHVYNGPCDPESIDPVVIYLNDSTAAPAYAGEDQMLCAPDNIVTLNANNATYPGNGQWTLGNHPGSPDFVDTTNPTTDVFDLAIGVTELIWTLDNGACGMSADTVIITVFDPTSPSASVDEDQFLCDIPANGCVDLIGTVPNYPAYGWWEQIAGDSMAFVADTSASTTTACGLAINESAFVWHIYNGACNPLSSDTIWFYIYDSAIANASAGADTSFCGEQSIFETNGSQLTGTIAGLASGVWTPIDNAPPIDSQNDTPNAIILNLPIGVHCYNWTVDNGACGISSDEMCIRIFDDQQQEANAGLSLDICSSEFVEFVLNGTMPTMPATASWSVIEGPAVLQNTGQFDATVLSMGVIETELVNIASVLQYTIDNGVCGTSSDTLVLLLKDCETIKVPDAYSPNDDGTNDFLIIPNIEYYPQSSLKIFNRWGNVVYEAAPYKNDWQGECNQSASLGDELPTSTYYYILDLGEVMEDGKAMVFNGFIYLKR
jgi:gliding motility-associated-like protein